MDSKVVNKLIRSEIWPLLREQGFSKFEARNAFRYRGPFINVVNFQSFNSYLADGIGCTTFSFAVNIGVYVEGCEYENLVQKDSNGLRVPREYQCPFRASLKKQTPIDGFERSDIFFVDANGHTAAACFQEVIRLLTEITPKWFDSFSDLDWLLSSMRNNDQALSEPTASLLPIFPLGPGSMVGNDLFATLKLLKQKEEPEAQWGGTAFHEIEQLMVLPFKSHDTRHDVRWQESQICRVRELWDRLDSFAPIPQIAAAVVEIKGCLTCPVWAPSEQISIIESDRPIRSFSAKEELWPFLRSQGFSEFTDRLAHRVHSDSIEVVEISPPDRSERSRWKLPEGLFRISIGIFWPLFQGGNRFRTNRFGKPRPRATECHLRNWLVPKQSVNINARCAVDSPEDARELLESANHWFALFSSAESAWEIFQQDEWEICWRFPMMSGQGMKSSTRRQIFLARFAIELNRAEAAQKHLEMAELELKNEKGEYQKTAYREWIDALRVRIKGQVNPPRLQEVASNPARLPAMTREPSAG